MQLWMGFLIKCEWLSNEILQIRKRERSWELEAKGRQPRQLGSERAWLVWKRVGCQHAGLWLNTLPNSDFWQAGRFQWKWTSNWWFIASVFKTACLPPAGVLGEFVVPLRFPTLSAGRCFLTSHRWPPLTAQHFSPSSLGHFLPPLLLCYFLSQLPNCEECFP